MALLRDGPRGMTLGRPRRPTRKNPAWRVFRYALLALAGLMIVTAAISYSNNKLRRRRTYLTLAETTDVVHRFHHDFQRWPDSMEQLMAPPAGQDPYLTEIPRDAWGNPFRYEVEVDLYGGSFRLVSSGPDGEPGTRDDIVNL